MEKNVKNFKRWSILYKTWCQTCKGREKEILAKKYGFKVKDGEIDREVGEDKNDKENKKKRKLGDVEKENDKLEREKKYKEELERKTFK